MSRWLEVAAQFSLLHWDDLQVAVVPAEAALGSSAGGGNQMEAFKVKCLRTKNPGLSLLVTDLVSVYHFSATGEELQEKCLPLLGPSTDTDTLIEILRDMLQPHQPDCTISAVRTPEGCLNITVVRSLNDGFIEIPWTFPCVPCGSPTEQAMIIRDHIVLPLQDMVNQLYFSSHVQAQLLNRQNNHRRQPAFPHQPNLPQRSLESGSGKVVLAAASATAASTPFDTFVDSFRDSFEEHLQRQDDNEPSLVLSTVIDSPDSRQHLDHFTESEEFRRSLGKHYEKVMTMRHSLGAQGCLQPQELGRLQDEMNYHRLSSRSFSSQDFQLLLGPSRERLAGSKRPAAGPKGDHLPELPSDADNGSCDSDDLEDSQPAAREGKRQRVSGGPDSSGQPMSEEARRRLELKRRLEREAKRNVRKRRKQFV